MKDSIIIYSSPSCPQCKMIKMQLKAKGLEYTEVQDVEMLASLNIQKLPTLKVNDTFLVGAQKALAWIKENHND